MATTHRNAYMTDELQAIYDQTVEFVGKEVEPHGDAWEAAGKVPRDVLHKMGELGMMAMAANPVNVIAIAPALIVTKDEIDEGMAILDQALEVGDAYAGV